MLSFLGKTWQARGEFDPNQSLFENFLRVRNFIPNDFPEATFEQLENPWLFREMKKSVERIIRAIREKERIMLFGDYDLDGMSGTAILFLALKHLGAEVSYRLPSRADGYGLSEKFVNEAAEHQVKLLITIDCGISNFKSIDLANTHGINVVVTDHHSVPEKLPSAWTILHPLAPEESFPDKNLTGAGVAFFLALALLEELKGKEKIQTIATQLLELAVLGTVADCGILLGQNRLITLLGIEALRTTKHPGLSQLLQSCGTTSESLNAEAIAFYLAPRLNVAGRLKHPSLALDLLCRDFKNAPTILQKLEALNRSRQEMVEKFVSAAEAILQKSLATAPALIVKNPEWPAGVIGLIAARLAEKYGRPTIVLEAGSSKLTASGRGPEDFHLAKALQEVAKIAPDLFLGFGGHATAAGFSILPEKFSEFQELFQSIVERERGTVPPPPKLFYDLEISFVPSKKDLDELKKCEPFGSGNPNPSFLFSRFELCRKKQIGSDGKHLLLHFQKANQTLPAIFFRQGENLENFQCGKNFDLLGTPELKTWQGQTEIQVKISDLRLSAL